MLVWPGAHYVRVLNFLPQYKAKVLQGAMRALTNIRGAVYKGLVSSDLTIHSKQCLFFLTADTKDQNTEAETGLSKRPARCSGQCRQTQLLHEATLGDSLWIRRDFVVSAGTLCPEFTVTGRVTQYPAMKDGEAESALKLPLWSGDWSGKQTVRT